MTRSPVRIAVLFSGSASSFRWLHRNDLNFGRLYKIVGVFSDVPQATGLRYAKDLGIPTVCIDYRDWCRRRKVDWKDIKARRPFFAEVMEKTALWNAEAIMLSGCMLIVTDPFYSAFEGRMINVHPALLSILDTQGRRKHTGLNVVARAMDAGDPTGSTVHIVTREPDMGPIVVESAPLPYKPDDDPDEHQNRMKAACDGPAFKQAFEVLIASGWPETPWQPT